MPKNQKLWLFHVFAKKTDLLLTNAKKSQLTNLKNSFFINRNSQSVKRFNAPKINK